MNQPVEHPVNKAVDRVQERLTSYANDLNYDALSPQAIHAARVRVIDTLGALIGGFFGETCRMARNVAAQMPNPGATIIGTRMKTTPDMAAFVNATTARDAEMNDLYHGPASHGHPSDVVTPLLAVAEHARANGSDFITGVVLAYEVYLRLADIFHNVVGFDSTNFGCIGIAIASGKLLGLSPDQLGNCISMAVVPNNVLGQVRSTTVPLSMFKSVAAGQAGRAGVFAALLARAGMVGPHLPFEGKAGWCDHVARERFSLDILGGAGTPFKILDTSIKHRAACGSTISSLLAAEKVAPLRDIKDVKQVTVEVYQYAKKKAATDEHHWNPESRETADHSIPYIVAATLMEGTVTSRSFNDAHLRHPELRALMERIEVIENAEFTKASERSPVEHLTRVTVVANKGERLVGESGGDSGDDLSAQTSDVQIEAKFRELTEDFLGTRRVNSVLDRLWHLDDLGNVAAIPAAFILD